MEEYLQMKVKRLSNVDGPRTPHSFLNIVFPMDMFYGFSLPGKKYELITRIFLFIVILKKNSFERDFWVEKVTVL